MINRKLNIVHIFRRNSYRYYCIAREARFLQKLINSGKTGGQARIPKATDKSSYAVNTLRAVAGRRNVVLNKVFMDHVSDLTCTGAYDEKFQQYGISITECKITRNLKVLFVYWIHTKEINEEEVDELLTNFATYLSHNLASFSVMNVLPKVRLVKDSDFMEEKRISALLETLSFVNEKEADKNISGRKNISSENKSNALSMQNTVFGLDYSKILKNIVEAKTASEGNIASRRPIEIMTGQFNFDEKKLANIFRKNNKIKILKEIENMPEGYPYHDDNDNDDDTTEESDIYDYDYLAEEDSCLDSVQDPDSEK